MCPPPPAWRRAARALLAAALLACAAAALAELWLGAGLLRAADGLSAGALGVLKRPLLPPPVAAPRGKGAAPPPPSPWPPTPLARQRRVAARTCGPTAAYVADAARRYAAPGEAGVLVFDWSARPFFNGLGDELLHYLQLLTVALDSGRAGFVATQRADCGSPGGHCRFDLADHFGLDTGGDEGDGRLVMWGWNNHTRGDVMRRAGWAASDEFVLRWTSRGLVAPDGRVLAPPEGDVMATLRATPEWREHRWVRVALGSSHDGGFEWGRWCHPGAAERSLCVSYNLAIGRTEDGAKGADKAAGEAGSVAAPDGLPRCGVRCDGACFVRAALSPVPRVAEALTSLDAQLRGAGAVVALQARTGFADVQRKPRPSVYDFKRFEASAEAADALFQEHVDFWVNHTRQAYPSAARGHCAKRDDLPPTLSAFLECAREVSAKAMDRNGPELSGEAVGYVLSSDSPAVLARMERAVRGWAGRDARVVTTADLEFGHVSFGGSVAARKGHCGGAEGCAFDHAAAAQRSLLDYLLLASADELMVMFRSAFPLLSNEYHVGGRRTHIFVGQPFMHAVQHVVDRADAPRCVRAKDECRLLARLWDILGDSGKWE